MSNKMHQGDVVFLKHENTLPDGTVKKHPVLILNCRSSIYYEGQDKPFYIAVMLTSSQQKDGNSIPIIEADTESPFEKYPMQVRRHLLFSFCDSDISTFKCRFQKKPLQRIIKEVRDYNFNFDTN